MRDVGIRRRFLPSRGEASPERLPYVLWLVSPLPGHVLGQSGQPVSDGGADGQEQGRGRGNNARGYGGSAIGLGLTRPSSASLPACGLE